MSLVVTLIVHIFQFSLRNDGTEFGGSIYQKVNDKLETAVNLAWTAGNSNTRFGIAAKYQIDPDASFSVSISISTIVEYQLPILMLSDIQTDGLQWREMPYTLNI